MYSDFNIVHNKGIWFGQFSSLSRIGFINACSCRLHGESDIARGTLNLALHVGDDPNKVKRNRQKFANAIGVNAEYFTTCEQVHGTNIVLVTGKLAGAGAKDFANTIKNADALITDMRGVPLLLFFADCVPVFLADPVTGTFAVIHAGWRGSVGGIVRKTINAMRRECLVKPENLYAAIGPSIGPCCYEVDDAVLNQAAAYEKFFKPRGGGKYLLDLWSLNRQALTSAGVEFDRVSEAKVCTFDNPELFFSYRAEHGRTGRMGACLCHL